MSSLIFSTGSTLSVQTSTVSSEDQFLRGEIETLETNAVRVHRLMLTSNVDTILGAARKGVCTVLNTVRDILKIAVCKIEQTILQHQSYKNCLHFCEMESVVGSGGLPRRFKRI